MAEGSQSEILVVEDDATIRTILEMVLRGAGYTRVRSAGRGDEGLEAIRRHHPDLVLLDIMLPGMDGLTVCRRVRESSALADVRIVMLTARTQNEDIVRGLECGADDYVTKPFDRRVLLARIQAVLRRGGAAQAEAEAFDGLVLDRDGHVATLAGNELKLAPGEFRILALLVANRGRVLTRGSILDAVLEDDRAVTERTVDVQIAGLRKKLGDWAEHIETIRGVGYRVRP